VLWRKKGESKKTAMIMLNPVSMCVKGEGRRGGEVS